jgi:hypothetical protein
MSPMIQAGPTDKDLLSSVEGTYRVLRTGLGLAALALPPVLFVGGRLRGVPLKPSISAYYYTNMRDVFVGTLFAAGAIAFLYKGFSKPEDRALNLAGIFALGVALVPMPTTGGLSLHGTLAVLFFLSLAYVAIFRPKDTLKLVKDPDRARRYRAIYAMLGAAMLVLPVAAAGIVSRWPYPQGMMRPIIFSIESAAIYAFGAFWLVKSREIRETQQEMDDSGDWSGAERLVVRSATPTARPPRGARPV